MSAPSPPPILWTTNTKDVYSSFSCVVIDLCIVSVCEPVSEKKNFKYQWCRNLKFRISFLCWHTVYIVVYAQMIF